MFGASLACAVAVCLSLPHPAIFISTACGFILQEALQEYRAK